MTKNQFITLDLTPPTKRKDNRRRVTAAPRRRSNQWWSKTTWMTTPPLQTRLIKTIRTTTTHTPTLKLRKPSSWSIERSTAALGRAPSLHLLTMTT